MTLRLFAPALAAIALLASPVQAESIVTLKANLDVAGETIALSDVFDGVPENADAAVARAPAPGAMLSIDPSWLQRHARNHGLTWPNAGAAQRVTVRRLSQSVSGDVLAGLVRDALAEREFTDYVVSLATAQSHHLPVDVAFSPRVNAVSFDALSRTFSAEITLADRLEPIMVSGRAEPSVSLPVLARNVARGETVGEQDITYVDTPASRVPADAIADADAIIGLSAKRALRAGVAMKAFDLERPTLIARGDVVVVRFDSGALSLTARARALDDVAEGDQARFVNLQSSRVIEAVAVAPGEAWLVASISNVVSGGRP